MMPNSLPQESAERAPIRYVKGRDYPSPDYVLIQVDTNKLDRDWSKEKDFYIPRGGPSAVGNRRERFQQWLKDNPNTPVEAPFVSWNDWNQSAAFSDGRHRFSVLRDMGYPTVGIVIPRHDLKYFKPLMKTAAIPRMRPELIGQGLDLSSFSIQNWVLGEQMNRVMGTIAAKDPRGKIVAKLEYSYKSSNSQFIELGNVTVDKGVKGIGLLRHMYKFLQKEVPSTFISISDRLQGRIRADLPMDDIEGFSVLRNKDVSKAAAVKTKWEDMMESPEYKDWLPKAYERELHESWVEYVPIAQLMPLREYHWSEDNSRQGKEEFLDTIEDIKRHGVRSPITIRYFKDTDTAVIIEGNHRVAAAKAAGLTEVPARVAIASYPRKEYGKDRGAQDGGPVRGLLNKKERIFDDYIRPSEIGLSGVKKFAATTVTYPKKRKPQAYHFQPLSFDDFLNAQGFTRADLENEEDLEMKEEEYDSNVEHFGTLAFPVTIYRSLELPEGTPINFDKAGVYWSWVEDSAQPYFGGSSMWSGGGHAKGKFYMIKAQVTQPGDVDWQGTLRANFIDPEENEIRVLPGAELKLLGVQGEKDPVYKPVPGQMTITASHKTPAMSDTVFPNMDKNDGEGTNAYANLPEHVDDVNVEHLLGIKPKSVTPQPSLKAASEMIRLYRGLEQPFNENFDLTKTDAPNGYSTWTDNPELAKQYAGTGGYVYQIDLPKSELGRELVDEDGERPLFINTEKKVGLNGVKGNEFLIYQHHDHYSPSLIKLLETHHTAITAGAGDRNTYVPRENTEAPALHTDPLFPEEEGKTAADQLALPGMAAPDYGMAEHEIIQLVASDILQEYAQHHKDLSYRQRWEVVPAARLIKIWNDYVKMGFVRDERGLDEIEDIILTNIAKLRVNTILCGHESEDNVAFAEDILGEELPEDYFDNDGSFFEDEKGAWRLSDYALKPLEQDAAKLRRGATAEQRLQTIDHILNIVHQRSDLSSWFIEGGQATLNRLAGK